MPDFLPRREEDLLAWSANVDRLINAAPGDYGISPGRAAEYRTAHDAFAAALGEATNPGTRTPVAMTAKNAARETLKRAARLITKTLRGTAVLSEAQMAELGLKVRKKAVRRISLPPGAPSVSLGVADARKPRLRRMAAAFGTSPLEYSLSSTVTVRLTDPASPTRTARPRGFRSATIYTFIGEEIPTRESQWTIFGQTTKTAFNVDFPTATPGAQIWVTARWEGMAGQLGPFAHPRSTRIAGGLAAAPVESYAAAA